MTRDLFNSPSQIPQDDNNPGGGIIQQALTPGKPLAIIINPSGDFPITAGESGELRVTVSNQGNQSALIDIFIDETSEFVRQWCVDPRERLALNPGQSSEVVFKIEVPPDAVPKAYNYRLLVDAPHHYPEDTPIQHKAKLQVMPFVKEAQTSSDPTFFLNAPTSPDNSSENPALIQPGETIEIQVLVQNRSERVDRFHLACPELRNKWFKGFKVRYPESTPIPGLITYADGLELNPGEEGEISLLLTPPAEDTLAGIYSPTIRLYSANDPNLVLLDVFYLQVGGVYQLDIEMVTLIGRVKNQAGLFELQLSNRGNTSREVTLNAHSTDGDTLLQYTLKPERVKLLPETSSIVRLEVIPPKSWWRRPFAGRLFNFVINVEDTEQLPLVNDQFQGTLTWESRPWWHFLLLILAVLGAIGGFVFLMWWLFFRPKALPQIVEFVPESTAYKEVNQDVIRLNWEITQSQRLKHLKLVGFSPDGLVTSEAVVYDFSQGIPSKLKNFCTIDQAITCQNIPTDARKAGDYIFELTIVPKKGKGLSSNSLKTNTIRIEPVPQPKITDFAPTQAVYEEKQEGVEDAISGEGKTKSSPILLNWEIENATQIQELQLIGRSSNGAVNSPLQSYDFGEDIAEELEEFCSPIENEKLICNNVPTNAIATGTYIFELTVISKQRNQEQLAAKKTDSIQINPVPIPTEIVKFQINGTDVRPKHLIQIDPQQPIVLTLSWQVTGGKDIEVKLLPAPGTVEQEGVIAYELGQQPNKEIITLQASNEAGEPVNKSVIIETFAPPPSSETALDKLPTPEQQQLSPPEQEKEGEQTAQTTDDSSTSGEDQSTSSDSIRQQEEINTKSPPIPLDRNSPPPSELDPQIE